VDCPYYGNGARAAYFSTRGPVAPIRHRTRRRTEPMNSILKLAFKLLVNDRAKFQALVGGITFSTFLIVQMTSLFVGILTRASSTVLNIGAKVWVMDPAVTSVQNSIGMPDYVIDFVRSTVGVRYAVPLYSAGALVKLRDGTFQPVTVLGLDDPTLYGRPALEQGAIEDIYADNGFIVVHDAEFNKLGNPGIGTEFELNDHRAVIVGVAAVASSGLYGIPTLYTTYTRALQYIPSTRFTTAYILVEPKSEADIDNIKRQVRSLGYVALTADEFVARVARWYTFQTGGGMNMLMMALISFIVGLSISGQTFYTFILENEEKFGALKAIGAKGRELVYMILFQATFTAFTGLGLGIGLCTILIFLARLRLPDYAAMVTLTNLAVALVMVIIIAAVSSYVGIRRVLRIEPFDIFRG
jgi:putative ABC transport system permease protein